jgi:hypothetical protein
MYIHTYVYIYMYIYIYIYVCIYIYMYVYLIWWDMMGTEMDWNELAESEYSKRHFHLEGVTCLTMTPIPRLIVTDTSDLCICRYVCRFHLEGVTCLTAAPMPRLIVTDTSDVPRINVRRIGWPASPCMYTRMYVYVYARVQVCMYVAMFVCFWLEFAQVVGIRTSHWNSHKSLEFA